MTRKYTVTYKYENRIYKTEIYARSERSAVELFKMWHRNNVEIVNVQ